MVVNFDVSKIGYSCRDKNRKIKLPISLTEDLAEFIGIVIGDGCIEFRKNNFSIRIAGDSNLDYEFHTKIMSSLTKKLFNLTTITKNIKNKNAILTSIYSKAVVHFLVFCCEMKPGDKIKNRNIIPNIIKEADPVIIKSFLRGLADTDFNIRFKKRKDVKKFENLHHHPLIEGHFGSSKEFILELHELIKSVGFNNHIEYPKRYLRCTGKTYQNYKVNI